MAQEQSYSQNQKQTQTQIQIQKTDKDEIRINTLDTEEEIPEIPEDSDNDDYSETYINKNEKREISFETEILPSKKYYYQIGKTEKGYFVVNFSNQTKFKRQLQKIIDSFPVYEKLTADKVKEISKTSRGKNNDLFDLDKDLTNKYEILFPDGEIQPLSIFVRGKGNRKENYYALFRKKMYLYKDFFNNIKFIDEDVEYLKKENLSEFIFYFLGYLEELKKEKSFNKNIEKYKFHDHLKYFFHSIFDKYLDKNNIENELKNKSQDILNCFKEYREYFLGGKNNDIY